MFRHCTKQDKAFVHDTSLSLTVADSQLKYGDWIVVKSVQIPKKSRHVETLVKLSPDMKLNNSLGCVRHNDLHGQHTGCILKTSTSAHVYAFKPNLLEAIEASKCKSQFSIKVSFFH